MICVPIWLVVVVAVILTFLFLPMTAFAVSEWFSRRKERADNELDS